MKTILDHLSEIESVSIRKITCYHYVNNLNVVGAFAYTDTLLNAVAVFMDWEKSKEGADFWKSVYGCIQSYGNISEEDGKHLIKLYEIN